MAVREILAGSTSQTIYVELLDSTSTTGGRKTGLAFNTSSLTGYYTLNGGTATAITLATLAAANSAWSSGGFKEVDATHAPGLYRLDLPNAAVATGPSVVISLTGATGLVSYSVDVPLVATNPYDGVRMGLTALPNAAANAAGGLPVSTAGGLDLDEMNVDIEAIQVSTAGLTYTVSNQVDANVLKIGGTTQTAADVGGMVADTVADVDEIITTLGTPAGASIAADLAEIEGETDAISATLGTPAGASVSADIAEIEAETDGIATLTIKKNTALAKFPFFMVDGTDHFTGKTGLTVVVQVSLDGAAFGNAANTPATELANGVYYIDLAAADLNGNTITFKATSAGADATIITIVTQP